jgi:hypothetical protein
MDQILTGSGTYSNDVSGLAISADGSRFVVGTSGDEGGLIPHLSLYHTGATQPYAHFNLAGSVMGLCMSDDGDWVAVARKSTHASVGAGGGSLELFYTRDWDLRAVGAPRLDGPPVRLQVRPDFGPHVTVVWNDLLEAPPTALPGGTLFIARQGIKRSPLLNLVGGNYVLDRSFPSQGGHFVGRTLYFQGLGYNPLRLTQDHLALTVLP